MVCSQVTAREKFLGTVVSIVVGLLSTGILIAAEAAGASVDESVLYASLIGNFLGYSGDILIAKQCFDAWDGEAYVPVRYDQWDVEKRFVWYVKSLVSKSFLRFVLTVTIDIIVSLAIIDIVTQLLEDLGIKFGLRNTLVAGLVSVFTFHVFVNEIRFNYAYSRSDNFTHDLIVFAWASTLIVVYILLRKLNALPSRQPAGVPTPVVT